MPIASFFKPIALFSCFSFSLFSSAQSNFDAVSITATPLSNSIYMLEGAGGNIGVSVGDESITIIDNQFAPLTTKILKTLKTISNAPVKVVINSHHHGDHTGGNSNFEKQGATIMAHENVKKRLKAKAQKTGLPVITYRDKLHININDEDVFIFHVDNAHTDGDSMLYFTENNVLHTGDTFFNGRYPYIDLNSGGSVNGYINAVKAGVMLTDAKTKIIPGHGKLASKKDYQAFLTMLEDLKSKVLIEIANGKTEDDIAANTAITKTYDALNYGCCFVTSEKIRRVFYKSLSNKTLKL